MRSRSSRRSRSSAGLDEVDDEDERLARCDALVALFAVTEGRRNDELAPSTFFHPGDTLLPALDDLTEREAHRLAPAVPRGVELRLCRPRDADVLNGHVGAGVGLGPRADLDVLIDEL